MGFEEWINIQKFLGQLNMDGGPGSGNWGHAGRPGQRGGSGPGGGKAYRIHAEFGFTSKAQTKAHTKKTQKYYDQKIGKILKEDEYHKKKHLASVADALKPGDAIHYKYDGCPCKFVKKPDGSFDSYIDLGGGAGYQLEEEGYTAADVASDLNLFYAAGGASTGEIKTELSWEARIPKEVPIDTAAKKKAAKKDTETDERFTQGRKDAATWKEDQDTIHEMFGKDTDAVWAKATKAEQDAIISYTGFSYSGMNKALYEGTYEKGTCSDGVKEKIDNAKSFIDKASTSQDSWLERKTGAKYLASIFGVSQSEIDKATSSDEAMEEFVSKHVGASKSQAGFLSAGSNKGGGVGVSGHGVILNLYVPKGSKAVYVEPFSLHGMGGHYKGKTEKQSDYGEFETIIQANSTLVFRKIEYKYGEWYIDADVITP